MARLRQLRLHGLRQWYTKEIISILPILLQIASTLFLAGLLLLLWQLNESVAIVATVLVMVMAAFHLTTIILPLFKTQFGFLSPPSRLLIRISLPLRQRMLSVSQALRSWLSVRYGFHSESSSLEASTVDNLRAEHPYTFLTWKLLDINDIFAAPTWYEMEGANLSRLSQELDGAMVASAYTMTMEHTYLVHAAVCTTQLTPSASRQCLQAISSVNSAYFGQNIDRMKQVHPCMWSGSIVALMMDLSKDSREASQPLSSALDTAYTYLHLHQQVTANLQHRLTRLLCQDFTYIVDHYNSLQRPGASSNSPNLPKLLVDDQLDKLSKLLRLAKVGNGNRKLGQFINSFVTHRVRSNLIGLDIQWLNHVPGTYPMPRPILTSWIITPPEFLERSSAVCLPQAQPTTLLNVT